MSATAPRSSPPARVLFVAGLGHSGSTLLGTLLGAHPQVVAVGEVEQTLRHPRPPEQRGACSCGLAAAGCPLWGPVLRQWPAGHQGRVAEAYRTFLHQLAVVAPAARWSADISKNPLAVRALLDAGAAVDAVLLTRDVRAWTGATIDRRRRRGPSRHPRDLLRDAVRYSPWQRASRWAERSRRIERELEALGVLRLHVGYEQLATAPARTLAAIAAAVGLPDDPVLHIPARDAGHSLRGNRRTLDAAGPIVYSTRWIRRPIGHLTYRLRPDVRALNQRLVHPPLPTAGPPLSSKVDG